MPSARTDLDRQVKIDQILDAAESRLTAGGYEGLSVAAIARELGVAQNSVYWYFGSKDELFVATFRRILARLIVKKPHAGAAAADRVVWVSDQMAELSHLRSALRDRVPHSQAAAELASELEGWIRQLLTGSPPAAVAEDAGEVFIAAVDGLLARGLSKVNRRRLVRVAFERLVEHSERRSATDA